MPLIRRKSGIAIRMAVKRECSGQTNGQHDPPNDKRQADQMVENHLEKQDRQETNHQRQAGRHDVGELDAGPRPLELVIDELLVIQQLAVRLRLRSQSHDTCSSQEAQRCVWNLFVHYTHFYSEKNEGSRTSRFSDHAVPTKVLGPLCSCPFPRASRRITAVGCWLEAISLRLDGKTRSTVKLEHLLGGAAVAENGVGGHGAVDHVEFLGGQVHIEGAESLTQQV